MAGNTAQVTFTAGKNRKCPIKNLSKDEFVDLSTGEVKMRRHAGNRFQSPKSVRKSINSLMDLIRCNATNHSNCKWITLTYREEMTDCKRVFKDNKAFLRKLRSYLKKQKLPESKTDFKLILISSDLICFKLCRSFEDSNCIIGTLATEFIALYDLSVIK